MNGPMTIALFSGVIMGVVIADDLHWMISVAACATYWAALVWAKRTTNREQGE